jgi:hypothetical protein
LAFFSIFRSLRSFLYHITIATICIFLLVFSSQSCADKDVMSRKGSGARSFTTGRERGTFVRRTLTAYDVYCCNSIDLRSLLCINFLFSASLIIMPPAQLPIPNSATISSTCHTQTNLNISTPSAATMEYDATKVFKDSFAFVLDESEPTRSPEEALQLHQQACANLEHIFVTCKHKVHTMEIPDIKAIYSGVARAPCAPSNMQLVVLFRRYNDITRAGFVAHHDNLDLEGNSKSSCHYVP